MATAPPDTLELWELYAQAREAAGGELTYDEFIRGLRAGAVHRRAKEWAEERPVPAPPPDRAAQQKRRDTIRTMPTRSRDEEAREARRRLREVEQRLQPTARREITPEEARRGAEMAERGLVAVGRMEEAAAVVRAAGPWVSKPGVPGGRKVSLREAPGITGLAAPVARAAGAVAESPPARALIYPYEKTREFLGRELEPIRQMTLALASPGLTTEEKQAILKSFSETRTVGWLTSEEGKKRLAEVEPLGPETKLENLLSTLHDVTLEETALLVDPLNLVPILGFTKIDDFVRAVQKIARTTKNPGVRRLANTVREAAVGRTGEAGGRVPGKPPPVEPPPPTDGMPPLAPLDDSSRSLDYFLGAPKSEKAQRTLIRRYEGQVTSELTASDVAVRGLYEQAKKSGIKFSTKPTREVPDIMQALDYPGPLDEAIGKLGLSAEEATLTRQLRGLLDGETALLKRDVPNFTLREFYWPHELIKPPRGLRIFRGRPVGAKPGFTRRRRLQGTLVDILEQQPDLVLYSGDPIAVVQRRLYQGALYRQQFVLTEQMKRVGLAVRRSQLPEGVTDWRTPKDVVSFNSRPVPGKPDVFTEPWVVPGELARAIEDNFARSAFVSNVPLNILRQTVAGLKFVKTFGGLFQHIDYSMRTLASATRFRDIRMVPTIPKAFADGFYPGLHAKWVAWEMKSSAPDAIRIRALLRHGLNTQAGLAFIGREYEALAREFFLFRIPFVGRMLKAFGAGTFQNAHGRYMKDIGEKMVEGYQRQGMTLDEAAAKVALDMNERFSSLPAWQSILRGPTTRDIMRLGFFSMAEQESWIRMPARQKAFFAAILVNTIGLSNMVSLMTTGKPLPPEAYLPFVKNPDSAAGFSYNVRFLRPELPWKGPDGRIQYLDLLGQADTPLRIIGDPRMALATRLGQVPTITGQIVAGEAAFGGEQIEGVRDIGMFVAEQVSPIPAAGFWGEQQRIGLRGAGIQAVGLNVSAEGLRDLRNRTAQEELGKPYDELTRQERLDWRAKHPEQFATSAELAEGSPVEQAVALNEERNERIGALGVQLENGEITGSAYRAARGDILREIAARRSEIAPQDYEPQTDEDKALDLYYRTLDDRRMASPTRLLESEDFEAAELAVIDELGEEFGEALRSGLMASADRVEKAYLTDRQAINDSGWWEIKDRRWREEAEARELASADMAFNEVRDLIAQNLLGEGIEPTATQIERKLREHGWGDVLDQMADDRIRFRINHPEMEARLVRWRMGGLSTVRSEDAIKTYRRLTGRDIKPAATGVFRFSDGRTIENLGRWCEGHDHEVCRLV